MPQLASVALEFCVELVKKKHNGYVPTVAENELYEASARFATTILNFQDVCSQAALIESRRELNGKAG